MKIKDNPSELAAILTVLDVKGLGPVKFKLIYEKLKSFRKLFELSVDQLQRDFKFGNAYIFKINSALLSELSNNTDLSESIKTTFTKNGFLLSDNAKIQTISSKEWKILDDNREFIIKKSKDKLSVYINITHEILYQKNNLAEYYQRAEEQIKLADKLNAYIISFCDTEYPPNLYRSNHSVPLLYVRGDLSVLKNEKCCAIVGTRNPSNWAIKETKKAAKKLVDRGYTIVSGLALGIDATAHKTALKYGGKTIAVLGCGVDISYPPQNSNLKREIEENGGAVISEYSFGTKVKEFRLKKRNKITVGLSKFVLITQTSEKGGTMNAYRAAIEQKKTVGVFYPPESLLKEFDGNLKILKDKKIKVLKFTTGDSINFGSDYYY